MDYDDEYYEEVKNHMKRMNKLQWEIMNEEGCFTGLIIAAIMSVSILVMIYLC